MANTGTTSTTASTLDNLSRQQVVDVVARLKHVHGPHGAGGDDDGCGGDGGRKRSGRHFAYAILSDGKHVEVILKLWDEFSQPVWIRRLTAAVGALVDCRRLATRHDNMLDALTLTTTAGSSIRVLSPADAAMETIGLTPTPDEEEQEQDRGASAGTAAGQKRNYARAPCPRQGFGHGGVFYSAAGSNNTGPVGQRGHCRRFLGVDHLLACDDVVGLVELDARFVTWQPAGGSDAAAGPTDAGTLVERVCSRCSARMQVDQNHILSCHGGCAPVQHISRELESVPWEWAYRPGKVTIRAKGPPTITSSTMAANARLFSPAELTVDVPSNMMQHMMLGIPPGALADAADAKQYIKTTGMDPRAVAAQLVKALACPGACTARFTVECHSHRDDNGQMLVNGRSFVLRGVELL